MMKIEEIFYVNFNGKEGLSMSGFRGKLMQKRGRWPQLSAF